MSETSVGQNKTVTYLLVAVAALLAAVIGLLLWQNQSGGTGGTANNGASNDASAAAAAAAANSPQPSQSAAPFDPKKATVVPSGTTPEEFLKGYYEAVKKGDYKTAYDRLPSDKKAAQDLASFEAQLKGYGITGYSMDKPVTTGDEQTIVAYQETGFGAFGTTWTFVKQDGKWLVKGKAMGGMK